MSIKNTREMHGSQANGPSGRAKRVVNPPTPQEVPTGKALAEFRARRKAERKARKKTRSLAR